MVVGGEEERLLPVCVYILDNVYNAWMVGTIGLAASFDNIPQLLSAHVRLHPRSNRIDLDINLHQLDNLELNHHQACFHTLIPRNPLTLLIFSSRTNAILIDSCVLRSKLFSYFSSAPLALLRSLFVCFSIHCFGFVSLMFLAFVYSSFRVFGAHNLYLVGSRTRAFASFHFELESIRCAFVCVLVILFNSSLLFTPYPRQRRNF
jgi:hypothetical protein